MPTGTPVGKELRAEATVSSSPEAQVTKPKEEGLIHLEVPRIYFTCLLTVVTRRKVQQDAPVKEAILTHFSTNPVTISIMMIYTFDWVKVSMDITGKQLDNVYLHCEERYQKSKLQSKVCQQCVNYE